MSLPTYIQPEELKSALELTGSEFAPLEIERACDAASRVVEDMTGRVFYRGTNGTVRYFTPTAYDVVQIDDATAVTLVEFDTYARGDWQPLTFPDDYWLEPISEPSFERPYTRIRLRPGTKWAGYRKFDYLFPNTVRVTGTFGWSAVPADVKTATLILATKLVRRQRDAPLGVMSIVDVGSFRVGGTDRDIDMLLNRYLRRPLLV